MKVTILVGIVVLFAALLQPGQVGRERPRHRGPFVAVSLESGERFRESFRTLADALDRATRIADNGYYDRVASRLNGEPNIVRFYPAHRIALIEANLGN